MQYPMNLIAAILISAVIAYLLGSISFSIIFTKYFNKEDIRTMGSGNAGMTNVLRSAGLSFQLFWGKTQKQPAMVFTLQVSHVCLVICIQFILNFMVAREF